LALTFGAVISGGSYNVGVRTICDHNLAGLVNTSRVNMQRYLVGLGIPASAQYATISGGNSSTGSGLDQFIGAGPNNRRYGSIIQ